MKNVVFSLLLTLGMVASVTPLSAQSATPTSRLAFDQQAPSLAVAQGYVYKYSPDGNPPATTPPVTCTGTTSPYVCSFDFPAFAPGAHSLTLTAGNEAGDSAPSAPFNFTFVVVPQSPTNLRVQ